jgi:hypothetical protein
MKMAANHAPSLLPVVMLGAVLLTTDLAPGASAAPQLQGPLPLSMVGSVLCLVQCVDLSSAPSIAVTYNDTQGATPLAEVHGVIAGTASSNVTVAVTFSAGESGMIPIYVGGLPAGAYTLSTFVTSTNGSALSGTSVVVFEVLPDGSVTLVGGTAVFTLVGAPALSTQGYPGVLATYKNNLDEPVEGFVSMVVYNSLGQTLDISTSTITPSGSGNVTTFNVIFGLGPGTYNATIFVMSVGIVALSNSTSFSFTL